MCLRSSWPRVCSAGIKPRLLCNVTLKYVYSTYTSGTMQCSVTELRKYGKVWPCSMSLAVLKEVVSSWSELFKKRKGTLGQKFFSARVVDLWNELDDSTVSVDNVTVFKRKLGNWVIKQFIVVYSGFNTDYGSSEPLKTLVMLCMLCKPRFRWWLYIWELYIYYNAKLQVCLP